MSKITQAQRVLEYINEFGSITQFEALRDLGVMRLAARIADLRQQGIPIQSETVTVKNRFDENCSVSRYRLEAADGT